jgi:hypothetical protein
MGPDVSNVTTQLTASAVAVYLIQTLKKAKWFPVLSDETSKIGQRIWAILAAAGTAFGIHAAYSHASGELVLSGLPTSIGAAGGMLWAWIKSMATQEWIYRSGVKSPAAATEGAVASTAAAVAVGAAPPPGPLPRSSPSPFGSQSAKP